MATAYEAQDAIVEGIKRSESWRAHKYTEDAPEKWGDDFYGMLDGFDYVKEIDTPLGPVSVEESDRGGEGHGEGIYVVFRLDGYDGSTQYFRVDGYYASWDGENWDDTDLFEVTKEPVQAFRYAKKS